MNALPLADLLALFGHFLVLSLLAVGGAITTAPDMHRYVVLERGWISDAQFTSSIALAQAAPGPNILFVAVVGWNVAGWAGATATMLGILLPSTALAMLVTRWRQSRQETRGVRAFSAGMAPITMGLLLATGWILSEPTRGHWGGMVLTAATVVAMWRTRLSPMWMVAAGAVVGMLGWA